MFDSTKDDLIDILRAIDAGKLQLPEFQRSYVWNDSDVRSLIASVAKGYLRRIQDKQGLSEGKLDAILRTHLIEPTFLRIDDFEGFFNARMKVLADLVSGAMGKAVVEGDLDEESGPNEIEPEEIEEYEALEGEAA